MTEGSDGITLLDEDGKTHEFSLVDVVEVDGTRYAILQPSDQADEATDDGDLDDDAHQEGGGGPVM